ncbi:unnamed protein product [Vicia faba]|uniref:Uncharacterized protein n=1 Tax=Vicia faba TaxID=3906 RepID=A0AAV0YP87_VICFA|nr:unnamed protein product [Vicia faba]
MEGMLVRIRYGASQLVSIISKGMRVEVKLEDSFYPLPLRLVSFLETVFLRGGSRLTTYVWQVWSKIINRDPPRENKGAVAPSKKECGSTQFIPKLTCTSTDQLMKVCVNMILEMMNANTTN